MDDQTKNEEEQPYGVKITFRTPQGPRKPFEGELAGPLSLITEDDVSIEVVPEGDTEFDVFLESFTSREEAENFGRTFCDALFWGALNGPSVLLEEQWVPRVWKESYSFGRHERPDLPHEDFPHYSNGPLLVYDLRHDEVDAVKDPVGGELGIAQPLNGQAFFISVTEFLNEEGKLSESVRTAIQIYASASHEQTSRAQFVSTISALEPLVERKLYTDLELYNEDSDALEATLEELLLVVDEASLPDSIQQSWQARIEHNLRRESISQALKRMVEERIPEVDGAPSLIREAYSLRSRILHEGATIEEEDIQTVIDSQRLVPLIISSFIDKEAYRQDMRRRSGGGLPSL